MSPELDRLVASAEGAYQDARLPNEVLSQRTTQAIVRATLMALREPGEDALAAAAVDMLADVTDPWDCMPRQMDEAFGLDPDGPNVWGPAEEQIRPNMKRAFAAMLNHILDTDARRAAALQNLADIDRDLL